MRKGGLETSHAGRAGEQPYPRRSRRELGDGPRRSRGSATLPRPSRAGAWRQHTPIRRHVSPRAFLGGQRYKSSQNNLKSKACYYDYVVTNSPSVRHKYHDALDRISLLGEARRYSGNTSKETSAKTVSNLAVILLSSLVGFLAMSGCTTTTTYWDQNAIRRETLRYYNSEVMENLIRASKGLLFVHVDLNSLQATVTTNYAGNIGGGQTLVNSSSNAFSNGTSVVSGVVTGAISLLGTAATEAMRPLTFTISPQRSNVIQEAAKPTFGTEADVYSPYLRFLNAKEGDTNLDRVKNTPLLDFDHIVTIQSVKNFAKIPEHVQETVTRWEGALYYVPSEFRSLYFQLCLELMARPKDRSANMANPIAAKLNRNYRATQDLVPQINSIQSNQFLPPPPQ
jgi:hypothetical protein